MLSIVLRICLGIIYPQFCVNCNRFWTLLCPNCFAQLDFISLPLTTVTTPSVASTHCAVRYGPVAHNLVHAAKFQSVKGAATLIGTIIFWYCRPPPAKYVVPVPLGNQRLGERGFNQAAAIAQEYCKLSNSIFLDCMVRTKETKAQAQQTSQADRLENMRGLFALHHDLPPGILENETVLLIDDVVSTGATLESCAQTLLAHGAKKVHAQAFAHGQVTTSRGIIEVLHGDVLH